MDRFTKVYSTTWEDKTILSKSQSVKLLYIYLLTCPQNNQSGYFRLTKANLKNAMCREDNNSPSGYSPEDEEIFDKEIYPSLCEETKLWKYDEATQQVLVPNYLKYNSQSGSTQIKGIRSQIELREACWLHIEFFYAAKINLKDKDYEMLLGLLSPRTISKISALGRSICKEENEGYSPIVKAHTVLLLTDIEDFVT